MQQSAAGGFSLHLEMPVGTGAAVLRVHGELDAATASELEASLGELLANGTPVVIDLSAVPFIDSAGLNAVVRSLRLRRNNNIVLAGAVPAIARMIEIRGLNRMVAVYDTVEAATASLTAAT